MKFRKIYKYHMIIYDPITNENLKITSNDLHSTNYDNLFIFGISVIFKTLTLTNNKISKNRILNISFNN